MTSPADLVRLQQAVRESRADVAREYSGLIRELDFRRRFTESVKRHPLGWIGGAVSAGLLAALFGTGGRAKGSSHAPATSPAAPSVRGRAGWVAVTLEVARILYPVLRPVIGEFLGNAARSGLARRGRLR